jgi:addiction module RelE/StbE family toxin
MLEISYTSKFHKAFRKLPRNIQINAANKIELFQNNPFNRILRTHELSGVLKDYHSFSINYHYRILFVFEKRNKVTFLNIGTHSIYN